MFASRAYELWRRENGQGKNYIKFNPNTTRIFLEMSETVL